jgi:hypothetical protein
MSDRRDAVNFPRRRFVSAQPRALIFWRPRLGDEWRNAMRAVFALGLLIALGTAANAATMLRSKSAASHLRPSQRVIIPKSYAVPGWTDEETRKWLYRGSSASGLG